MKRSESGSGNDGGDGNGTKGRRLENGLSNGNHVDTEETKVNGLFNGKENTSANIGAFDVNKLQKLRSKGGKKTDTVVTKGGPKAEPKKKMTKKNRVWDDSPPETKLDFTDPVGENGDNIVEVVAAEQGESMMDKEEDFSSESESEEEEVGKDSKPDAKKKGWFSSMFHR